jgi:hypothetical protein
LTSKLKGGEDPHDADPHKIMEPEVCECCGLTVQHEQIPVCSPNDTFGYGGLYFTFIQFCIVLFIGIFAAFAYWDIKTNKTGGQCGKIRLLISRIY